MSAESKRKDSEKRVRGRENNGGGGGGGWPG